MANNISPEEQRVMAFEKINKAIPDVFTSDNFKKYLDCVSKFHNYSYNNIILIQMQKPDATILATYKHWMNKLNRQIIDKVPIKILIPSSEENGLQFRLVSVFDISQTEGQPINQPQYDMKSLIRSVIQVADASVKYVSREALIMNHSIKGYYSRGSNQIIIRENMSESETAKTLVHEYVFSKYGDDLIEAEAIAYVVSKHFGLDINNYRFPYVVGWASDKSLDQFHELLMNIQRKSNEMIETIEEVFKEEVLDIFEERSTGYAI